MSENNEYLKKSFAKSFLYMILILILLLFFFLYFIFSNGNYKYDNAIKNKKNELLKCFLKDDLTSNERFYLTKQLEISYKNLKDDDSFVNFLLNYLENHPDDPYNSYYYYSIAETYYRQNFKKMALINYKNSLSSLELRLNGKSIHLNALKRIIELEKDYFVKSFYYKFLVENIDKFYELKGKERTKTTGEIYYNYIKFLKEIGDYQNVYLYYKKIIKLYKKQYPALQSIDLNVSYLKGVPNFYYEAEEQYRFYLSPNKPVFKNLNTLISKIRTAIVNRDSNSLLSYRSNANFFAMTYTQDKNDYSAKRDRYARLIEEVLNYTKKPILVSYALDKRSTSKEAYLKTYGWNYSLPNWYFYFKKVDYPLNKEIDGGWEWAGLYMGEFF